VRRISTTKPQKKVDYRIIIMEVDRSLLSCRSALTEIALLAEALTAIQREKSSCPGASGYLTLCNTNLSTNNKHHEDLSSMVQKLSISASANHKAAMIVRAGRLCAIQDIKSRQLLLDRLRALPPRRLVAVNHSQTVNGRAFKSPDDDLYLRLLPSLSTRALLVKADFSDIPTVHQFDDLKISLLSLKTGVVLGATSLRDVMATQYSVSFVDNQKQVLLVKMLIESVLNECRSCSALTVQREIINCQELIVPQVESVVVTYISDDCVMVAVDEMQILRIEHCEHKNISSEDPNSSIPLTKVLSMSLINGLRCIEMNSDLSFVRLSLNSIRHWLCFEQLKSCVLDIQSWFAEYPCRLISISVKTSMKNNLQISANDIFISIAGGDLKELSVSCNSNKYYCCTLTEGSRYFESLQDLRVYVTVDIVRIIALSVVNRLCSSLDCIWEGSAYDASFILLRDHQRNQLDSSIIKCSVLFLETAEQKFICLALQCQDSKSYGQLLEFCKKNADAVQNFDVGNNVRVMWPLHQGTNNIPQSNSKEKTMYLRLL
jgi:hypothetical protein